MEEKSASSLGRLTFSLLLLSYIIINTILNKLYIVRLKAGCGWKIFKYTADGEDESSQLVYYKNAQFLCVWFGIRSVCFLTINEPSGGKIGPLLVHQSMTGAFTLAQTVGNQK